MSTSFHPAVLATDREARIDRAVIDYEKAIDRGDAPDLEGWIARHPDLEPELREYFRDRDAISRLGQPKPQDSGRSASTDQTTPFSEARPDPDEEREDRIGDYVLLDPMEEGGQGTVFRARHFLGHLTVALKLLHPRGTGEGLQEEIRAIAGLRHDHIIRVFSFGRDRGRWYYTMELMENGSLQDRLREHRFTPREAASLLERIARGVHHAHSRGILHLDLKPANILLDGQGRPLVSDFGLARHRNEEKDIEGQQGERIEVEVEEPPGGFALANSRIQGTIRYMSPEMASGAPVVSTAADVYGLGAILYAMLTGRTPTQGTTLARVIQETPIPPRDLNPGVDRELQAICLKCLSKDPAGRYGSADALANDLRRWANREPTLAMPQTVGRHLKFWLRRHPWKVATACLAALVLWGSAMAGSVGELHSANAREARRLAQDVDRELNLIRRAIRIMARDPRLIGSLKSFSTHPEAERKAIEAILTREARRGEDNLFGIAGGSPLVNVLVMDEAGELVADSLADSPSIGRNYAHRDYYRGLFDPDHPLPRNAIYVAKSFLSVKDGNYKVAFSTRVRDEERLLGILVANVTIGPNLVGLDMTQEAEGAVVTSPMDWSYPERRTPPPPPRPPFLIILDRTYTAVRDGDFRVAPHWPGDRFHRLADFERDRSRIEASDHFQDGDVLDYHRVGETSLVVALRRPYPWPIRWALGSWRWLLGIAALAASAGGFGFLMSNLRKRLRRPG